MPAILPFAPSKISIGPHPPWTVVIAPDALVSPSRSMSERTVTREPVKSAGPKLNAVGTPPALTDFRRTVPPPATAVGTFATSSDSSPVGYTIAALEARAVPDSPSDAQSARQSAAIVY